MGSIATGEGGLYSPLATPTRSSLRRQDGRAPSTPNSVRFFGITQEDDEEHTDNVGVLRGRNSIEIKHAIFSKYFNEFTSYPLLLPASSHSTRGTPRSNRSVRSATITTFSKHSEYNTAGSPWTPLSSTHVPSAWDSPWPRWAVGRRQANSNPEADGPQYPSNPFYAATSPVKSHGKLTSHLKAFEELLSKRWTRQEVEQAHVRGFFRRLIPQLGEDRLQACAALLLAACARLHPPLLPPLTQGLCSALPSLISSPREDARQAGLCLLGLLWRAALSSGSSQLASRIVEAPKLMGALCARLAARDFDALWAVREVVADSRGAVALERHGVLRHVCRALRRLVRAAERGAAGGEGDNSGGGGEDRDDESDGSGGEDVGRASRTLTRKTGAREPRPGSQPSSQQQQRQQQQQLLLHKRRSAGASASSPLAPPAAGGHAAAALLGDAAAARQGVTEGGGEVERAAEGVLVADCLAAFTSVLSATVLMCKRYRVPERLVALLLVAVPEEVASDGGGDGGRTALGSDPGAVQTSGSGSRKGSGGGVVKVPKLALKGSQETEVSAVAMRMAPKVEVAAHAEDRRKSSGSSSNRSSKSGSSGSRSTSYSSTSSSSGSSSSSSVSGRNSGCGGGGSSTGRDRSGGVETETDEEAEAEMKEVEVGPWHAPSEEQKARQRWSAVRRSQLQLQEALLRCLYAVASSGQGQEPSKAVQAAVRDAGDLAVRRLVRVLQERHRLEGCNAAAYLLWLCVAGDFSAFEGSELNVLRSRMGSEAPPPPPPRSAAAGDWNSGLGVVTTVSELLLRHLPDWRDVEMGDCVPAVRTTVPPIPSPVAAAVAATGGVGALDGTAAVNKVMFSAGSAVGGSGDGGAGSGAGSSGHPVPAARSSSLRGGVSGDGVLRVDDSMASLPQDPVASGVIAMEGAEAIPRGLPQLRVLGSSGVLLTPRDGRAGHVSQVSPQRYSSDSSDEGEPRGTGGGDGAEGGPDRGGRRHVASGGTADQLGNTQDMDLSNVIDSSVELTGKEQIMQMIREAGSALRGGNVQPSQLEDSMTVRQDEPELWEVAGAESQQSHVADGDHGSQGAVHDSDGGPAAPAADMTSPQTAASDDAPGTGSSPEGAPEEYSPPPTEAPGLWEASGGADAVIGSYAARRPPALTLPLASLPPRQLPLVLPSSVTFLGAVRRARGGGPYSRRGPMPLPSEVQDMLSSCTGLLSAVALSASGCRAVCSTPELLPYLGSLLDLPMDLPDSAAAAALSDSCLELRLQLLYLLTNISIHPEGAGAISVTTAASPGVGSPSSLAALGSAATLAEILYGTALLACEMISSSPTSWATGMRLLEPCFTVMTNIHRCPGVQLSIPADLANNPRDSYSLAIRALSMPLPASMGAADRTRLRAAAARMLDSAVAAFEGVRRGVPAEAVSELVLLLSGWRAAPGASAAAAAAGALWQLLAGGMVHPEAVAAPLREPLVAILRNPAKGDPELRRLALGLVSCLARSPLIARRLWTSPVLSAVMQAHAMAVEWGGEDEASWRPTQEAARLVCQQLCRVCHTEDRGEVSGTDKRVDKWGMVERMMVQLKSRLEFDYDEEAIMLVPLDG